MLIAISRKSTFRAPGGTGSRAGLADGGGVAAISFLGANFAGIRLLSDHDPQAGMIRHDLRKGKSISAAYGVTPLGAKWRAALARRKDLHNLNTSPVKSVQRG